MTQRSWTVLAILCFIAPLLSIPAVFLWAQHMMRWKSQLANLGMKVSATDQFNLKLADYILEQFPFLALGALVATWTLAALCAGNAFRTRRALPDPDPPPGPD